VFKGKQSDSGESDMFMSMETNNSGGDSKKKKTRSRKETKEEKVNSIKYPVRYEVCVSETTQLENHLKEEVDAILAKCSAKGEKCVESVDEGGKVHVTYEPIDATEGLIGQHQIFDRLSDKLGGVDVTALKEYPWVGSVALPGTSTTRPSTRKTHAFVVTKEVIDKEMEPLMESLLADPTANAPAKTLIDLFDYGKNRCAAKQSKLNVITGVSSSAQATLQQRLVEKTDGLFQTEEERQLELAQELAETRDKQADKAFKEWARTKLIEKKKKNAKMKKEEKLRRVQEEKKRLESKKKYNDWKIAQSKAKKQPPKKKLVQKAWSFAPPTEEEDFMM